MNAIRYILILCTFLFPVIAKGKILSSTEFSFPNTAPGVRFKIDKVIDGPTGGIKAKCQGKEIAFDVIEKMQRAEDEFIAKKFGAAKEGLRNAIDKLKDDDSAEVSISLRYPKIEYLDKTKHTVEECRNHSLKLTTMKPEKKH